MLQSMTVEEIMKESGSADVWALLGDGIGYVFIITGSRGCDGVALTYEDDAIHCTRSTISFSDPTERYLVRIYR